MYEVYSLFSVNGKLLLYNILKNERDIWNNNNNNNNNTKNHILEVNYFSLLSIKITLYLTYYFTFCLSRKLRRGSKILNTDKFFVLRAYSRKAGHACGRDEKRAPYGEGAGAECVILTERRHLVMDNHIIFNL